MEWMTAAGSKRLRETVHRRHQAQGWDQRDQNCSPPSHQSLDAVGLPMFNHRVHVFDEPNHNVDHSSVIVGKRYPNSLMGAHYKTGRQL